MINWRILGIFLLTLLAFLIVPTIVPSLKLVFFAPFIIICFYRYNYTTALFISFAIGLLIDCYCIETRLGFYALVYLLTTMLLYSKKLRFFDDNASTLPIMAYLFGIISTSYQWLLMFIFEKSIVLSVNFFVADLIIMPFFDMLYSLIFIPLFLKKSVKRSMRR